MTDQQQINYDRIEKAIGYIHAHFKEQPSLDVVANAVGMSPFHFQRMFTQWAGVSPKKFMQYLSVNYAKQLLSKSQLSLLETALQTGLSGSGRLHDLFINIEGMTPGEFKHGGEALTINYQFCTTLFGKVLIASTPKGICHLFFISEVDEAFSDLVSRFPNAHFQQTSDVFQQNALKLFQQDWTQPEQIRLHLKGTDFQLKVWEALLSIPMGQLTSYGHIAQHINHHNASRAVGTAIGSNPVAFLIPCHRVIQASGNITGYRWGSARKAAMIGWEASRLSD